MFFVYFSVFRIYGIVLFGVVGLFVLALQFPAFVSGFPPLDVICVHRRPVVEGDGAVGVFIQKAAFDEGIDQDAGLTAPFRHQFQILNIVGERVGFAALCVAPEAQQAKDAFIPAQADKLARFGVAWKIELNNHGVRWGVIFLR